MGDGGTMGEEGGEVVKICVEVGGVEDETCGEGKESSSKVGNGSSCEDEVETPSIPNLCSSKRASRERIIWPKEGSQNQSPLERLA